MRARETRETVDLRIKQWAQRACHDDKHMRTWDLYLRDRSDCCDYQKGVIGAWTGKRDRGTSARGPQLPGAQRQVGWECFYGGTKEAATLIVKHIFGEDAVHAVKTRRELAACLAEFFGSAAHEYGYLKLCEGGIIMKAVRHWKDSISPKRTKRSVA